MTDLFPVCPVLTPLDRMIYGPGMALPPVAPVRPDSSGDAYAWIADPEVPEVLAHLDAERAYYDARVAPLAELRAELAAEMVGRLPAQESSAPWTQGGFVYRRETRPGGDYDRLLRRPVGGSASQEVELLDLQAVHEAGGTTYTRDGQLEVSPDGEVLAWSVDLEGDELYTLRFRRLADGAALDDGTPIGDGNPLLKDKALRSALNWAIDRQALVDKVLGGGGSVGSTIIPPMYTALHLQPANEATYDPEKAKSLLDAAGYKVGSDGIRADAKGNKLSFRLFARSDSDNSQKSVQFIKSYFAAVGVETTVKVVSSDALTEIIGQGNFDMFEWGWVVEPDPNYQLSTFTCANRSYKDGDQVLANLSDSFYCNQAYDDLYAKQGVTTDENARWEIVKQMQQMLYDDSPYLITFYYDNPEAYRSDRFTGFVPQPDPKGALLFQYGTWSYENIKPVTADNGGGSSSSSSSSSTIYVLAAIAALVVIAIVVVVLSRRNRTAGVDDRE